MTESIESSYKYNWEIHQQPPPPPPLTPAGQPQASMINHGDILFDVTNMPTIQN